MKKYVAVVVMLILACNAPKKYTPAEDALDAAREFKDACLKGDFDKAKFYLMSDKKNDLKIEQEAKIFNKVIDNKTRKESKEASINIIAVKEISQNKSQIILSNSFNKSIDTITAVHHNNLWLVDLQ